MLNTMKLSEISTDKGVQVIVQLTPFISNIAKDEEILSTWVDKATTNKSDTKKVVMEKGLKKGIEKITKLIPLLLEKHKNDIYSIISILNEKSVEEVGSQPLMVTIKETTELINDKDFVDFFISFIQ